MSVGVVPDLRGFNDKLRAGLIPAANLLGKDMGSELTKGIAAGLDIPKIMKDATPKAVAASRVMGREMGKELTKGVADTFDIGKIIIDATRKAKPAARLAGKDLGDTYGKAFRRGLDDALKGVKAKVDVDLNKASLARAKTEIRDSIKDVKAGLGISGLIPGGGGGSGGSGGGGGGGAASAAGGAGFIGGINALIKALPGGTSGSIAAVPAPVLAGGAAVAAAAAPFLAQMLAGFVPLLGGGALAGLGVAGAFGVGGTTQAQVAQTQATSQAANARVRAAQARVAGLRGGVSGPSALAASAAGLRLSSAQERLQTALGGTSAAAILSAQAGVASAQDHINKLRATGGATTAQLASAEASLASARASQSKASTAYQKAQKDQITAGQESVRDSFKNLAADAKQSLGQIGAPMVPVMNNILKTVDKTMKVLTPVFEGAVGIISGPFKTFSDTILNAFKDPQVSSAISAVAKAFADVMKAFTPDIKGIMDSFADAIERIANSVSKNPKAFADFLNFIFQFGIMLLNAIAFLTDFADYIEQHFMPVMHDIAHIFDLVRHWVAKQWDQMWQDTIGRAIRAQQHVQQIISDWLHNIANAFDIMRHGVATTWDKLWDSFTNIVVTVWNGIRKIFASFVVDGILGPLGTILKGAATAFGWVPGIGSKLKGASAAFEQFKNDVNKSLGGINDQTVKVSVAMTAKTNPYPGGISGRAAGGLFINKGVKGRDDQLILAQRGELVVPPNIVAGGAVDHLRGYIPGFAAGGVVGGVNVKPEFPSNNSIDKYMSYNVDKLATQFAKSFMGSGPAVLAYAMSFLHKVPYVWGGSTPAGWDCSGFVSWIYDKFKLFNGRSDAAGFQAWAKASGPVPGGMAFYGSPAHHVGFVVDGHTLLSALGHNYGTTLSALNMGDNSGYGVPPKGFGNQASSLGAAQPKGKLQELAFSLLNQHQWGGQWGAFNSLENSEAGWNMNARNPSSGAYGLAQFINGPSEYYQYGGDPSTGLGQLTGMFNYIAQRYPSGPAQAWAFHLAHNWYAKGTGSGGAAAGWAWVGENGPELVNFSGGEDVVPMDGLHGYASGAVSSARSTAARNAAAAASTAAHNRALIAAATANRKASAAAMAAINKMANAGASLAAALAKITTKTTPSVFASDQAKFLADLRLYFNPSTARARSQLVIRQIKELQNLQTHLTTLSNNIANAVAFQKQTYGQIRLDTRIGTIGIQGTGAAGGQSILAGLQQRLSATRSFGLAIRDLSRAGASQAVLRQVAGMDPASGSVYARKMISALNKMHAMKLSPEMITQLVALGPDAALAYINAIQAGGPSLLKQVKSTEAALESARIGTSRGIASVVAGGGYNTGANFVAGLKSQEKALEAQFKKLGKTLGQEAIKWMRVPSNKRPFGYATGGWINEPISGIGQYSGALYTFAETGREYVVPEGQMGARGGDGSSQYHAHFDGLTGAAIESHVRSAFNSMALQQGALNRAGRRS